MSFETIQLDDEVVQFLQPFQLGKQEKAAAATEPPPKQSTAPPTFPTLEDISAETVLPWLAKVSELQHTLGKQAFEQALLECCSGEAAMVLDYHLRSTCNPSFDALSSYLADYVLSSSGWCEYICRDKCPALACTELPHLDRHFQDAIAVINTLGATLDNATKVKVLISSLPDTYKDVLAVGIRPEDDFHQAITLLTERSCAIDRGDEIVADADLPPGASEEKPSPPQPTAEQVAAQRAEIEATHLIPLRSLYDKVITQLEQTKNNLDTKSVTWDHNWADLYRTLASFKGKCPVEHVQLLYDDLERWFTEKAKSYLPIIASHQGQDERRHLVTFCQLYVCYLVTAQALSDLTRMHSLLTEQRNIPDVYQIAIRCFVQKTFLPNKNSLLQSFFGLVNTWRETQRLYASGFIDHTLNRMPVNQIKIGGSSETVFSLLRCLVVLSGEALETKLTPEPSTDLPVDARLEELLVKKKELAKKNMKLAEAAIRKIKDREHDNSRVDFSVLGHPLPGAGPIPLRVIFLGRTEAREWDRLRSMPELKADNLKTALSPTHAPFMRLWNVDFLNLFIDNTIKFYTPQLLSISDDTEVVRLLSEILDFEGAWLASISSLPDNTFGNVDMYSIMLMDCWKVSPSIEHLRTRYRLVMHKLHRDVVNAIETRFGIQFLDRISSAFSTRMDKVLQDQINPDPTSPAATTLNDPGLMAAIKLSLRLRQEQPLARAFKACVDKFFHATHKEFVAAFSASPKTEHTMTFVSKLLAIHQAALKVQRYHKRTKDFLQHLSQSVRDVYAKEGKMAQHLNVFLNQLIATAPSDWEESASFAATLLSMSKFMLEATNRDEIFLYFERMLVKRLVKYHQSGKLSNRLALERHLVSLFSCLNGSLLLNSVAIIKAIASSQETHTTFRTWIEEATGGSNHPIAKIELSPLILPSNVNGVRPGLAPLILGPALEPSWDFYKMWYRQSFNGRKLTLIENMTSVEADICLATKTYRILAPLPLFLVVALFFAEGAPKDIDLETIKAQTKIPDREIESVIDCLRSKIHPILVLVEGRDSVYSLNSAFKSKSRRVAVKWTVGAKSLDKSISDAADATAEQRKFYVDAAVVRILKARQTIRYEDLLSEVFAQLSNIFKPTPTMVKQRLEVLMEKEYLERDPDDLKLYRYRA